MIAWFVMVMLLWPKLGLAATDNPLAGTALYLDEASTPAQQIDDWGKQYPHKRKLLKKIADQPVAQWFGDWNSDVTTDVAAVVNVAEAAAQVPVLVLYTIPQRDCGAYSAGGSDSASAYKQFVRQFTAGIGDATAVVILEPDALGVVNCLSAKDKQRRFDLLAYAVKHLQRQSGAIVYIDAGHPNWTPAKTMTRRLQQSGITQADGFALNVSNFYTTKSNLRYGTTLSAKLDNAHFVIDTSRNGVGPTSDFAWCNPTGRGLGHAPTTATGHTLADAYLWIKPPGESDGTCNGGPAAGSWWLEYALELAKNANLN